MKPVMILDLSDPKELSVSQEKSVKSVKPVRSVMILDLAAQTEMSVRKEKSARNVKSVRSVMILDPTVPRELSVRNVKNDQSVKHVMPVLSVRFNVKSALPDLNVLNTSLIVLPELNVMNLHPTCPCVKLDLSAPLVILAPKSSQRLMFALREPQESLVSILDRLVRRGLSVPLRLS